MFENFSFDAPRSPSLDSSNQSSSTRDTSREATPCSPTTPFPAPRYSITDLTIDLGRQRIRQDAQICYESCDSYANMDDEAGWTLEPKSEGDFISLNRTRTAPASLPRGYSPSRRMERQLHTRLLCAGSHSRDIADLVARMVSAQDQCSITSRQTLTRPQARGGSEDDEGYDSCSEVSSVAETKRMDFKRSSDMRKTGTAISKEIRLRKDKVHKRQRSSEKS